MGVCRKLGISFSCFLGGGLIKCLDQLLAHLWICVKETSRYHFELIIVVIASVGGSSFRKIVQAQQARKSSKTVIQTSGEWALVTFKRGEKTTKTKSGHYG
jgi:hypothetical protein